MSATEAMDFEREFEELVRELRAVPAETPQRLREQVRALGEPMRAAQLPDRLRALALRRSLLVLAPVCVLGLVAAAVLHGIVNSGPKREAVGAARVHRGALQTATGGSGAAAPYDKNVFGATLAAPPFASPLP